MLPKSIIQYLAVLPDIHGENILQIFFNFFLFHFTGLMTPPIYSYFIFQYFVNRSWGSINLCLQSAPRCIRYTLYHLKNQHDYRMSNSREPRSLGTKISFSHLYRI